MIPHPDGAHLRYNCGIFWRFGGTVQTLRSAGLMWRNPFREGNYQKATAGVTTGLYITFLIRLMLLFSHSLSGLSSHNLGATVGTVLLTQNLCATCVCELGGKQGTDAFSCLYSRENNPIQIASVDLSSKIAWIIGQGASNVWMHCKYGRGSKTLTKLLVGSATTLTEDRLQPIMSHPDAKEAVLM